MVGLKFIFRLSPFMYCSTFEEHHDMIFNILWEIVVSSNINMKISAANLLKVSVSAFAHCSPGFVLSDYFQHCNFVISFS